MKYIVDLNTIKEYNTHHCTVQPTRAALLVMDMQNVFLNEPAIITENQINNINSIIAVAEKVGVKIIYVRHNDDAELSQTIVDWWGGDKIEKGSDGWQIISEFDTTGKTIVDKNQYSAFFKTHLDDILKKENIKDMIITGVMTNCCCETTARDAFMHGYRVFFMNDATATSSEELHLATLKNLSFGFAYVQNTQELIEDIMGLIKT